VVFAFTAEGAIRTMENEEFDFLFLDHDLGGEVMVSTEREDTGSEVVRWMVQQNWTNKPAIIIHSLNTPAARSMQAALKEGGFDHTHVLPFTALNTYLDDANFITTK
jgi:hypothetical protein